MALMRILGYCCAAFFESRAQDSFCNLYISAYILKRNDKEENQWRSRSLKRKTI